MKAKKYPLNHGFFSDKYIFGSIWSKKFCVMASALNVWKEGSFVNFLFFFSSIHGPICVSIVSIECPFYDDL